MYVQNLRKSPCESGWFIVYDLTRSCKAWPRSVDKCTKCSLTLNIIINIINVKSVLKTILNLKWLCYSFVFVLVTKVNFRILPKAKALGKILKFLNTSFQVGLMLEQTTWNINDVYRE